MSTINKETEIELSTGRTIAVELEVVGLYDSHYGADADGNRGQGRWLIDSHGYSISDDFELTEEEANELDEKVEELVYEGEWDFEAADSNEDDDLDFEVF